MRMPAAPPAPTHDAPPRGARGRGAETKLSDSQRNPGNGGRAHNTQVTRTDTDRTAIAK